MTCFFDLQVVQAWPSWLLLAAQQQKQHQQHH